VISAGVLPGLTVKPPAIVSPPLKRELPRTVNAVVEDAKVVPILTLFSLAFTTSILVSTTRPELIVEVAVPDISKYSPILKWPVEVAEPLILRVESKVDEARTNMPDVVDVGVNILAISACQAPGACAFKPEPSSSRQITLPEASVESVPPLVKPEQLRCASRKFEVTSKPAEAVDVAA
jgi:hypothetical protein